jgi:Ca2+-binding EF-hand superfamily protein
MIIASLQDKIKIRGGDVRNLFNLFDENRDGRIQKKEL